MWRVMWRGWRGWPELAKWIVQVLILCGLCPSIQANTTADSAQASATSNPAPIRIALLLPLHSESLRRHAQAVQAGFAAGYEREQAGITISLIETDDSTTGILTGYDDALANHDIVVGPLSRSGVTAI